MAKITIISNTETRKVSLNVSKKLEKTLKSVKEQVINVDNLTEKAFAHNLAIMVLSLNAGLNSEIEVTTSSEVNANNEYEIHLVLKGDKKALRAILSTASTLINETLNGSEDNCEDKEQCEDKGDYEDESNYEDEGESSDNCQAKEQSELFKAKKDFILNVISEALESTSLKELNEKGSIVINFN